MRVKLGFLQQAIPCNWEQTLCFCYSTYSSFPTIGPQQAVYEILKWDTHTRMQRTLSPSGNPSSRQVRHGREGGASRVVITEKKKTKILFGFSAKPLLCTAIQFAAASMFPALTRQLTSFQKKKNQFLCNSRKVHLRFCCPPSSVSHV